MATFEDVKGVVDDYYPLYINGQWVHGGDGERLTVTCPANGEVVTTAAVATKEDVDAAIMAAWQAWPKWRQVSQQERYTILLKIYERINAKLQHFAMVEALNCGKTVSGAVWEMLFAADQFPYFASVLRTHEDGISRPYHNVRSLVVREPVGVVGAITPWNAPFIMAAWKLAPALAAGNCVVLKPSSFTPASSMELIKEIADLLPPGVVNVVNGKGSTVGQWVLDHPGITKLSFTGSTEVGRTVGHAAAEKIIPATLELGGKSAGIYFGDIPEEKFGDAVACGVQNILMLAGQGCSLQSRILVEDTLYDRYVEALAGVFRGFKVGMPWEEDAQMGAIAYKSHMESILGYIDSGIEQGARLVCGGHRITDPPFDKGLFIEPTIFADVDSKMRIAQEEIFGPVVVVIKFHGEEEAVQIANDSVYGLGGGVFSGDLAKAIRVAEAVRTGTVTINGALSNPAGGAFGGFKESGIGRENYKTTLDHFSQLKTIHFPL